MPSSFLYFIPGKNRNHFLSSGNLKKALEEAGLEYLGISSPEEILVTECTIGPATGCVIVRKINGTEPDAISFNADLQTWIDCGKFRIGCLTAKPPGPDDLVRPSVSIGFAMTDAAGRTWTIPIARSPIAEHVTLPSDFVFDMETGVAVSTTKTEFDWLWELTEKLFNHWHGTASLPISALAAAAIKIIGVNYRVGIAESNLLQAVGCPLIDSTTAQLATLFCLDNAAIEEQKKKETTPGTSSPPPAGTKPKPGFAADAPDTAPVAAT